MAKNADLFFFATRSADPAMPVCLRLRFTERYSTALASPLCSERKSNRSGMLATARTISCEWQHCCHGDIYRKEAFKHTIKVIIKAGALRVCTYIEWQH
jgi:hypothetical protein